MLDRRLEDQLRATLREHGDGLPLTITVDELERRMTARRRAHLGRRSALLVAAVAVVAVGAIAALTNGWLRVPAVGVEPSPTPSPRGTAAPTPTPVPSLASGLGRIGVRPDGTAIFEIQPVPSGTGKRHVPTVAGSQSTVAWLTVDCRGDGMIEIAHSGMTYDAFCAEGQAFALTLPPSTVARTIVVTVPAALDYTILIETVPLPATVPDLSPLDAPFQVEGASRITKPDWAAPSDRVTTVLGTLDAAFTFEASYACLGPGSINVDLRIPGSPLTDPPLTGSETPCIGDPQLFTSSIGYDGPLDLVVTAQAGATWQVAGASVGSIPAFFPPELRLTSYIGSDVRDAVGQAGVVGCGYTWDLAETGSTGDQCGPPAWPPMTHTVPLTVVMGDSLQIGLVGSEWDLTGTIVRATPAEQLGFLDGSPRDITTLPNASIGPGRLQISIDALRPGRWAIRVDTRGVRGSDSFGASYFFLIDVGP